MNKDTSPHHKRPINPINTSEVEHINLNNGKLLYFPQLFCVETSTSLFKHLYDHIQWRQDSITLFGKSRPLPRLQAWYGDKNCIYEYSSLRLAPQSWTPLLLRLKSIVQQHANSEFNCVLINLYRNGKDSVSWHSDDEKELGINPTIASLSLGECRRFSLKHKIKKNQPPVNIWLNNGSLLVMQGNTQQYWYHQLPKTQKNIGPRINLTFRMLKH